VAIDLAAAVGGTVGDGQQDFVTAYGTHGSDNVTVAMSGGTVSVTGLPAQVTVAHGEGIDSLTLLGNGGNDTINAGTVPASALLVNIDGGEGSDLLAGSAGNNNLYGGNGHDTLRGGGGNDLLLGEAGNDHLEGGAGVDDVFGGTGDDVILGGLGDDALEGGWGNDTITGGAGNDTIRYTGILDGHDVILAFDGNATGGQDVLDLDVLFDSLAVATVDRAGRVQLTNTGATVDVAVNADGNAGNGFELVVATLHTTDPITIGTDVIVGTL
jgi:Ca2+-binding RTX toxin-like protein